MLSVLLLKSYDILSLPTQHFPQLGCVVQGQSMPWTASFMRSCIFQQHPQHTAKCLDKKSTQHINTNTSKHYLQSPAFPFSYTLNLILWLSIKLMPGRNGFCKKYGQRWTSCSVRDHWARQNGSRWKWPLAPWAHLISILMLFPLVWLHSLH